MKRIVIATLFGLGVVLVGAGAASAQAFPDDHPPNAKGECTARAEISNGVTVDPYVSGGTYTIPLEGSATYTATTPYSGPERRIQGSVKIKTPPGIPDISFDDKWDWDTDSTETSDSDTVDWEFPSSLPRGVEMTVEGEHVDGGGIRCSGSIKIEFEGGFFDSPIGWVAVGGTVVSGTGVALSAVSKSTKTPGVAKVPGATTPQPSPATPPPQPSTPPPGAPPADPNATVVDPDAPTVVDPDTPTRVDPDEGGAS